MTPNEFKSKWSKASGNEKQTYQEHFNDLCDMLHHPRPSAADRENLDFTFEKNVTTATGGQGFADVWKKGHFAWEYTGNAKNLDAAYAQVLSYAGALDNPPLLVVSDTKTIRIHTNFTNKVKKVHEIPIERIDDELNLAKLRFVFTQPEMLDPGVTPVDVTKEAAVRFGSIAAALQKRGEDPHATAHFLVQMLFCLFAEDVTILPRGLVSQMLAFTAKNPAQFVPEVTRLLTEMERGGYINYQEIPHVNGGLFREINVLQLEAAEIAILAEAAQLDWGSVEPAIFGTLFERSLDPGSRAKLGAHYTGKPDILRVVEPVVMVPLRRRWDEVRTEADTIATGIATAKTTQTRRNAQDRLASHLFAFRQELAAVRILDPACGSGNFLYVTLERLLELDKDVTAFGASNGLSGMLPVITTDQLLGLEINEYARELAQVVIWIGYLQWMIRNGYSYSDPVLSPMETIRLQDALLDLSDPDCPKEAEWPIIGNPPFLGGKLIRREAGHPYADALHRVFANRLPQFSDLCCYFFEKARAENVKNPRNRTGLLATNSIRGGANRRVLERIKSTGDIFLAWSDEPWVLDGAAVRISIICFDNGAQLNRVLDGLPVPFINSNLTSTVDITVSSKLNENRSIGFEGDQKAGPFEIDNGLALEWFGLPENPNGRENSDVIRRWANGADVVRRSTDKWIIDFGVGLTLEEAAMYEAPFEYIRLHVLPIRETNREMSRVERWWQHARPRPEMRTAISPLARFMVTTRHAKHRLFVWLSAGTLPDSALAVFARDDDYFFGILGSRAHEVWSLRMGTSLEDRPRYTPTTCFETFPLPWPPGQEPVDDPRVIEIAAAAKDLDDKRTAWLNPEGASETDLKKNTLTNLYNERPTWLQHTHQRLDRAVWSAYGWEDDPSETTDEQILERLLVLNTERTR